MLKDIKELDSGVSYDKYKYISDEQIQWLIKQAEIVESIKDEIKGMWSTEVVYVNRLHQILDK